MRIFLRPIKLAVLGAALTSIGAVWAEKAIPPLNIEEKGHRSSLTAKLTLLNGNSRMVTVEGVGCTAGMCSRVSLNSGKLGDPVVSRTWLDGISAIKDANKDDALFVFRDGSERRLSVVPLNRVLYVKNASGGDEKISLAMVRALEFIVPASK